VLKCKHLFTEFTNLPCVWFVPSNAMQLFFISFVRGEFLIVLLNCHLRLILYVSLGICMR
jgi:hypothetical protein